MNSLSRRLAGAFALAFLLAALPARAQSLLDRQGEATVTSISRVASAPLDMGRMVTAVRDGSGNLKVIVWDLSPSGVLTRRGDASSGAVKEVAVTALSATRFVTAVRKSDDNLGLASWSVDSAGNVTLLKTHTAGPILEVALAGVEDDRFATLTRGSANDSKVIQWSVNSVGTLTRGTEAAGPTALGVSLTALSPSRVVSAIELSGQNLQVTAWDVVPGGAVTKKGSLSGLPVTQSAIVTTASDRVITAGRLSSSGNLEVTAWDIDPAGNVAPGGSAETGAISSFALAPIGTTRVATAVRDSAGNLKLIAWQVVGAVKRLDTLTGGAFSTASIVNLGWDRLVTPLILSDQSLKLIAWRQAATGLLHARSGPAVIAARASSLAAGIPASASAAPAGELRSTNAALTLDFSNNMTDAWAQVASPNTDLTFQPGIEGVDPMITAGRYYLIISQQGQLGFFDKTGAQLPSKNGELTKLMTAELFKPLWQPTNSDNTVNRNNINLHLRLPLIAHPEFQCDPTAAAPVKPCMTEIYDTRVAHDPYTNRFVVIAAVRHRIWPGDTASDGITLLDPIVRRYLAFAISRSEDPRDGFEQYMMTEPNYSDWPRLGISNGVLTLAHNAPKAVGDWKPMAYTFSIADLSAGNAEPRNWKVDPWETGAGKMIPVIHHGSTSGWTYMIRPDGDTWELYSIKNDGDLWDTLPTFSKATVDIGSDLAGFREGIVFRNGMLHAAGVRTIEERVPDSAPEQFSVRILRIPILFSGSVPSLSKNPDAGYFDRTVGHRAPGDTSGDEFSYEMPSLAVNGLGDILVVFGRVPVNNTTPQQARYLLYDNSEGLLRSSRLLQAGQTLLTTTYSDATTATPSQYYRLLWDSSDGQYLDYANAVVDPSNDLTFWMAHEFASSSSGGFLKMVVGRVP